MMKVKTISKNNDRANENQKSSNARNRQGKHLAVLAVEIVEIKIGYCTGEET